MTELKPERGKRPCRLLVLGGAVGTGKTIAAAWALEQYKKLGGLSGKFISAMTLARANLRFETEDGEGMDSVLKPSLLVIDDLGTEFNDKGGSFLVTLDEVINDRCLNDRTTIITTNLTAKGFKERYRDRIASRVVEFGGFHEFEGSDIRRDATALGSESVKDMVAMTVEISSFEASIARAKINPWAP